MEPKVLKKFRENCIGEDDSPTNQTIRRRRTVFNSRRKRGKHQREEDDLPKSPPTRARGGLFYRPVGNK